MKLLKKIPFIGQLFVMGAIPLMLLGIAMGLLSYSNANMVVKESEKSVISDTINRIDINVNLKAKLINSFVNNIVGSQQMRKIISAWDDDHMVPSEDKSEIYKQFTTTLGAMGEVLSTHLFLGNEDVLLGFTPEVYDQDHLAGLYMNARISPDRVIWSGNVSSVKLNSYDSVIEVYEGILDKDGNTIGLVVIELSPTRLGSLVLTKQKILDTQATFIMDKSGNVIYSDTAVSDECLQEVRKMYNSGLRKGYIDIGGKQYYVCDQYNALTNWIEFSMIEGDDLFPGAMRLKQNTMILVLAGTLLAALCLFLLSKQVIKPLEKLNKGMREAQSKNFKIRIENDRSDEIGELTDSFNYMTEHINTLVNQVYREKIAQKNAEIEALQAQINPHFLYNTLDSINWMLIDEGEMEISNIVVALGKLMQYSMETSVTLVSLKKEIENIQDYLLIQKNRLEDRLEFEIRVEGDILKVKVPKLILQPLVENAIKHGIEPLEKGGRISVIARKSDERIVICVKDDGKGKDEEQLENYMHLLRNDTKSHTNIGVRNVAKRLRLHYNEECSFSVTSRPFDGVSITIEIPIEPTESSSEQVGGGQLPQKDDQERDQAKL